MDIEQLSIEFTLKNHWRLRDATAFINIEHEQITNNWLIVYSFSLKKSEIITEIFQQSRNKYVSNFFETKLWLISYVRFGYANVHLIANANTDKYVIHTWKILFVYPANDQIKISRLT